MNNITLLIGKSAVRFDAAAKVTGTEKYASDYYPENFLWLGVKRADYPHAKILKIDYQEALSTKGAIKILTAADIKGKNRVGVPEFDEPILCGDKVRHLGDPVALVIAESTDAVKEAISKIKVTYEVLEAVFDPFEAAKEGAPLIHDNEKKSNILLSGKVLKGETDKAFEKCEHIVEFKFRVPQQEHAYLESETGAAWLDGDGALVIVASTQTPFRDRFELSIGLGLPLNKIRIIAPYLGGGFGGKDGITVQGLLGIAALNSGGRPVKIFNCREESFISSNKRHAGVIAHKIGCDKNGKLTALDCSVTLDKGPYCCLGTAVLSLAVEHAGGIYKIPNVSITGQCVYTNNPAGGAFRGFGVPQVLASLEQAIDMLAQKAGIDSLEFRKMNAMLKGDINPCGAYMTNSVSIIECLDAVSKNGLWKNREQWIKSAPKFKKRGAGIAAALHGMGYGPAVPDSANAKIEILDNGKFMIYCGVSDMGQGNASTFVQIAGEILNQCADKFEVTTPDTAKTLPSGSASASRTTFTYANALIKAASILKETIIKKAATLMLGRPEELILADGRICNINNKKEFPLFKIAEFMDKSEKTIVNCYVAPISNEKLNCDKGLCDWGLPHKIFSFAAHAAFVEIDELTGEVKVRNYVSATDAGRVINPETYNQQVHGGIAQGIGYTLYEDIKLNNGEIMNKNFTTYILPTALDVCDIESLQISGEESEGPYGMKGLGEIPIDPVLPAIANAIHNACGARTGSSPITAEKILTAING